jgi:hypothetical protein
VNVTFLGNGDFADAVKLRGDHEGGSWSSRNGVLIRREKFGHRHREECWVKVEVLCSRQEGSPAFSLPFYIHSSEFSWVFSTFSTPLLSLKKKIHVNVNHWAWHILGTRKDIILKCPSPPNVTSTAQRALGLSCKCTLDFHFLRTENEERVEETHDLDEGFWQARWTAPLSWLYSQQLPNYYTS